MLCVYITWCKLSSEFGRIQKFLIKSYFTNVESQCAAMNIMLSLCLHEATVQYVNIQCRQPFYEQIVNEVQPSWLPLKNIEGELSNCFSINQLVR